MYCTKKIASDLVWVGANDRRLAMFEGVYSVPAGVSYNSYLLTDEKTVLFDTVDKAVSRTFFENLEHELGGRPLDYVIVHHMEPDHSATLSELLLRHPETTVVCNDKTAVMIAQFFGKDAVKNMHLVKEGDVLSAGAHELTFYLAPMIHWPEVMMTYDKSAHTLFTADAFGVFGALNGAIFADEVDFDRDYLKEARRYYTTSSANTACRCRISSRRSRVWTFRCSARCTASSGGVISDIFWKSTTSGAPIRRRTRA